MAVERMPKGQPRKVDLGEENSPASPARTYNRLTCSLTYVLTLRSLDSRLNWHGINSSMCNSSISLSLNRRWKNKNKKQKRHGLLFNSDWTKAKPIINTCIYNLWWKGLTALGKKNWLGVVSQLTLTAFFFFFLRERQRESEREFYLTKQNRFTQRLTRGCWHTQPRYCRKQMEKNQWNFADTPLRARLRTHRHMTVQSQHTSLLNTVQTDIPVAHTQARTHTCSRSATLKHRWLSFPPPFLRTPVVGCRP